MHAVDVRDLSAGEINTFVYCLYTVKRQTFAISQNGQVSGVQISRFSPSASVQSFATYNVLQLRTVLSLTRWPASLENLSTADLFPYSAAGPSSSEVRPSSYGNSHAFWFPELSTFRQGLRHWRRQQRYMQLRAKETTRCHSTGHQTFSSNCSTTEQDS